MKVCEPLCSPSACDCIKTSTANIKVQVSANGSVFITLSGHGEAYVIAEDFSKVIKETNTDVFDGKNTFNIQ